MIDKCYRMFEGYDHDINYHLLLDIIKVGRFILRDMFVEIRQIILHLYILLLY